MVYAHADTHQFCPEFILVTLSSDRVCIRTRPARIGSPAAAAAVYDDSGGCGGEPE